jgi:hypothetical protein
MKISVVILLFFSICAQAQRESLLYNESGQLIADTSFQLSSSEFDNWRRIESALINDIVNKLDYSAIAIAYNLNGNSIVSFEVNENGRMINFISIKSVGGGLEERVKIIVNSFSLLNSLKPKKGKTSKYYLALSFNLVDVKLEIKRTGEIPIGGNRFDYIQY